MGVTSSRPAEEHDEAAEYDDIFFSTAGAAPTSLEKPWGADNITIDDVAWHVAIAMSVIRAAGTPESELIEQPLVRANSLIEQIRDASADALGEWHGRAAHPHETFVS